MPAPPLGQSTGPITGGPCVSGAPGATAFRVHWYNSGGRATVSYDEHGLPDKMRWKVGVFGYGPGFNPTYTDTGLGPGGLQLDGSDFIDVEMSTQGVGSVMRATLSIYGRSFSTGSSGSFNWQTFVDVGATPRDLVSNATPYRWYGGDATTAIDAGNKGILLRIKAGPSSGALIVNKLELCIVGS